jgi:outer membrane protein
MCHLGGDEDVLVLGDEAEMNWSTGERRSAASGGAPTFSPLRAFMLATAGLAAICVGVRAGRAENLTGALIKAYVNNPTINSSRASVRAADENVPKANAGYLPTIAATGNMGVAHFNGNEVFPGSNGSVESLGFATGYYPRGYGAQLNQNVFDGYQTINRIRSAESGVLESRAGLRLSEQSTLLDGVNAYMDVLLDTALLELQRNNVQVLQEQLRETRDRFTVGEVTRTDVAQAEASLSSAQAQEVQAEATLETAIAHYRQVIGDQPTTLAPVRPITYPLPRTLEEAVRVSQIEHPQVVADIHAVDVAELTIKVDEGKLYPQVSLQGSVAQQFDVNSTPGQRAFIASIVGNVTVPIYQGGQEYATIRQDKEKLSQAELTLDQDRDTVRRNVVQFWGLNQASVGVIRAARAAVSANEVALAGVREEAKVGQRTTLDVLNAQQALLQARSNLVQAEHDAVVYSYSLLSAIGRLNAPTLNLAVDEYDPRVHFNQVKSKLWGVRTPDGK